MKSLDLTAAIQRDQEQGFPLPLLPHGGTTGTQPLRSARLFALPPRHGGSVGRTTRQCGIAPLIQVTLNWRSTAHRCTRRHI